MQTVNIDLDHLRGIADRGVRRAAVFMGLGLNAAHREDFVDYELSKLPVIQNRAAIPVEFIQENAPPGAITRFKQEFATWITGCGLREILEYYSLFLDHIHNYSLLVLQTRNELKDLNPKKTHAKFRGFGIGKKLEWLKTHFNIDTKHASKISDFYQVRNCLTHDLGIVMSKRFNTENALVVKWLALDLLVKELNSDRERTLYELRNKTIEGGGNIVLKVIECERTFTEGEKLTLSHQDLWGICQFFHMFAISNVVESFADFLKRHNIQGPPKL
ncbi:MAG: hypothetical protein SFW62_02625 [Alphaproteobacteria bacterium]|nr:hypothetical protein [Alphaproteobacteria bacterium]